jgi:outer membrane protein TolC
LAVIVLLCTGTTCPAAGREEPAPPGYYDFPTCVRYALLHSEAILKNRLQIQIRSADLKDGHSELLPQFDLVTRYYLARTDETSGNRMNVNVTMSNFNPYEALLKIKAYGIVVDMAKTSHIDKISEAVGDMAKLFFKIDRLKKQIRVRRHMLALRQAKLDYGRRREEQGASDALQVRLWENSVRTERASIQNLEGELELQTLRLKLLMGYHPDYQLPLDTRNAVEQVLGGYNGQMTTFSDIQAANPKLKILAKKEQLQSVKVQGTYVAILPRPVILLESLSNEVDRVSGFNFAIGVDHTLWDGFRKIRDIKRQKMEMRVLNLERHEMSKQLYVKYRQLRTVLDTAADREAIQLEQEKLAELNEERTLSRFKSGTAAFEEYTDAQIEKADAALNVIKAYGDRVEALIDLATIAGGLNRYHAGIRF